MSTFEIVNFDSLHYKENFNTGVNSYTFDPAVLNKAPNSWNANIALQTTKQNIKSISLRSMEIQNSFYNIRSTSFNNQFQLTITGEALVSTVTIPDGLYTSIQQIIDALNAAFTASYASMGFSISLDTTTQKLSVQSTNALYSTLYVRTGVQASGLPQYLAEMLGFRKSLDVLSGSGPYVCTACNPYSLSIDTYLNFRISNIPKNSNNKGPPAQFKIPISSGFNEIIYVNDVNFQTVTFDSPISISYLQIEMIDRYGYNVNSNDLPFSFSLILFYKEK